VVYTNDGLNWIEVSDGKLFQGNTNRTTIINNKFDIPVEAKVIRICPVDWFGHISMRMELYYEDYAD